eukprot:CAMPEP_0168404666 /NCGR_PEP_ID=MMETSP0228-20121227/24754_1 /TAXON_ID=133427 /ORGANISM="Protoceratium reticulatum, Strain CCCM 535 (=CCMP 1889)" /LENGTH=887 /DNA_ID=CAMNT_0008418291 /DNA_START=12 /DNA_END=2671 /DNA_ORIENTATION=-
MATLAPPPMPSFDSPLAQAACEQLTRALDRGNRARSLGFRRAQAKPHDGARAPSAARASTRGAGARSRGPQRRAHCDVQHVCSKEQALDVEPKADDEDAEPLTSCVNTFVAELIFDAIVEDEGAYLQEVYVDSDDEEGDPDNCAATDCHQLLTKEMLQGADDLAETEADCSDYEEVLSLASDDDEQEPDAELEAFECVQVAYAFARKAVTAGLEGHVALLEEKEEKSIAEGKGSTNVTEVPFVPFARRPSVGTWLQLPGSLLVQRAVQEKHISEEVQAIGAEAKEAQSAAKDGPGADERQTPFCQRPSVGSWLRQPEPAPAASQEKLAMGAEAKEAQAAATSGPESPQPQVPFQCRPSVNTWFRPSGSSIMRRAAQGRLQQAQSATDTPAAPAQASAPTTKAPAPEQPQASTQKVASAMQSKEKVAMARAEPAVQRPASAPAKSTPDLKSVLAEDMQPGKSVASMLVKPQQQGPTEHLHREVAQLPKKPATSEDAAPKQKMTVQRLLKSLSATTELDLRLAQPPTPSEDKKHADLQPKRSRRRIIGAVVRTPLDVKDEADADRADSSRSSPCFSLSATSLSFSTLSPSASMASPSSCAAVSPTSAPARVGTPASGLRRARHIAAQKDMLAAFRMDADDLSEDEAAPPGSRQRESSLAGAYEALGAAAIHRLDGGSDSDAGAGVRRNSAPTAKFVPYAAARRQDHAQEFIPDAGSSAAAEPAAHAREHRAAFRAEVEVPDPAWIGDGDGPWRGHRGQAPRGALLGIALCHLAGVVGEGKFHWVHSHHEASAVAARAFAVPVGQAERVGRVEHEREHDQAWSALGRRALSRALSGRPSGARAAAAPRCARAGPAAGAVARATARAAPVGSAAARPGGPGRWAEAIGRLA